METGLFHQANIEGNHVTIVGQKTKKNTNELAIKISKLLKLAVAQEFDAYSALNATAGKFSGAHDIKL